MEIRFLGTGGAFEPHLGNSSALVYLNNCKYLIDCGHTVYRDLAAMEKLDGINAILITHLHDDHCGSLTTLLYHYHYIKGKNLELLVPDEDFGQHVLAFMKFSMDEPSKYVTIKKIEANMGIGYINTSGHHVKGMLSYGYTFTDEEGTNIYSGDLGDLTPYVAELNKIPNINRIYQDVSFYGRQTAHAHYKDVETQLGAYDVYGYHCNHKQAPADLRIKLVANFPELLL